MTEVGGFLMDPYFEHVEMELSAKKEPFVASVFSLTSHEPYPLPEKYKSKYKPGTLLIHPNIQYTDEMLRNFFTSAPNQAMV